MNQENTQHSGALIGAMRESSWTMRSIASIVILTFGGLVTSPAVAAVKQEAQKIQWHKADSGNAARLSAKLDEAHKLLTRFASQGGQKTLAMADVSDQHSQIHGLVSDLNDLDKGAMDDFAVTEAHIQAHHLPAEIEQRQQQAMKTYRARMDGLMTELKAADGAKDSATFQQHLANAKSQLDKAQVQSFHEQFDPKHLPFSVAKPTSQKPRLSKKDYLAHPVMAPKRVQVAANGSLAGIVSMADLSATVPSNPGDPSYLAPTDDVQITPAVQAEAKALNNDPVQIYNWVHNNVEYIPTYGSIQGSDMTLQTLKGNDFDQASLLIALLRAANIPSRYVYGTIQVPIAQVENWVGGVTDPNAALNLLGQGGVPVTAVTQGGQIAYAQLEHVWVEAWVNFIPSRVAKSGPGNTWVPIDASFKQYTYTQGMNFQPAIPFDANTFAQQMQSSATSDPTAGWIQNPNQTYAEQQLANYQTAINNQITATNPQATVGQVVGSKTIVQQAETELASGLPYSTVVVSNRLVEIPDSLRWKFSIGIQDANGNSLATYTASTADLSGKNIALSFQPATANDADTIVSYITPDTSGSYQESDFYSPLPGYLINVAGEISVDGVTVASYGANSLGASLSSTEAYWSPKSGWQTVTAPVNAGEYHAIRLDLQSTSGAEVSSMEDKLTATDTVLAGGSLTGLSADDVTGPVLQEGLVSYFAMNDSSDVVSQQVAGMVEYRAPSFGTFKVSEKVLSQFGVPGQVSFPGTTMDINWLQVIGVAKNGDSASFARYLLGTGVRVSALEHITPQDLFNKISTETVEGLSAVKLLGLASSAGQRIYQITSTNAATVLPNLTVGDDVKTDIQNAVDAGDTAVVSQSDVTDAGWTGVGYILYDPVTGSGAYKIAGGANGSWTSVLLSGVLAYCGLIFNTGAEQKLEITFMSKFTRNHIIGPAKTWLGPIVLLATISHIYARCGLSVNTALISLTAILSFVAITFLLATPFLWLTLLLGAVLGFASDQLVNFEIQEECG